MLRCLDNTIGLSRFAGPGAWNDPDMLEVCPVQRCAARRCAVCAVLCCAVLLAYGGAVLCFKHSEAQVHQWVMNHGMPCFPLGCDYTAMAASAAPSLLAGFLPCMQTVSAPQIKILHSIHYLQALLQAEAARLLSSKQSPPFTVQQLHVFMTTRLLFCFI